MKWKRFSDTEALGSKWQSMDGELNQDPNCFPEYVKDYKLLIFKHIYIKLNTVWLKKKKLGKFILLASSENLGPCVKSVYRKWCLALNLKILIFILNHFSSTILFWEKWFLYGLV